MRSSTISGKTISLLDQLGSATDKNESLLIIQINLSGFCGEGWCKFWANYLPTTINCGWGTVPRNRGCKSLALISFCQVEEAQSRDMMLGLTWMQIFFTSRIRERQVGSREDDFTYVGRISSSRSPKFSSVVSTLPSWRVLLTLFIQISGKIQ